MTKNTKNSHINSDFQASGLKELTDLDSLFSAARESQPELRDDNFTKILVNSLPRLNPYFLNLVERKRVNKRGLSMDLIGGLMGLIFLFLFVDVSGLVQSVLSVIPESVTLSPVLLMSAFGGLMFASVGAWWSLENNKI